MFLASDVNYDTLSLIVQTTRKHGNEHRLLWDLMKLPHHCSYLALSHECGEDETKPVPEVAWLFEDRRNQGGDIISPSCPIPSKGSEADKSNQPPHRQAANYHKRISGEKNGEFTVTMEHPSTEKPERFAYKVTERGIAFDLAAPMVSTVAAASTTRAG
ncbi:hypothetical protein [Methyloceanibacter stevinii]|uniref:hypothetical protein n=1 Tax=Methyloceanibacter stevinii TaxID=1774970 RepID=UPI000B1284D2|nr:hypothetical protein [Methyloceanibacter stevinii]